MQGNNNDPAQVFGGMQMEELERMERMFTRVRDACFTKCIHRFAEAEISPGEGTCIDRCVIKYMKVYEKVGQRIAPDLQQPQ